MVHIAHSSNKYTYMRKSMIIMLIHKKPFLLLFENCLVKILRSLYTRILYAKFGWNLIQWFREEFFKFRPCIFAISFSSPLGKWEWQFIWINLNPVYPRMFCAKFGWIWPSGSEKMKMWKVYRQTNDEAIRKDHYIN